jgi:hypothetical protein
VRALSRRKGKERTLVSPGIGATLHTFPLLSVLMTLLFPTLGYPINPTDICFLSECNWENCRKSWIKVPLPKLWFGEAWKAIVGYLGVRCWI